MPSTTKRVVSIPRKQAEDLIRIINNLTPTRVGNSDDFLILAEFAVWAEAELSPERTGKVRLSRE